MTAYPTMRALLAPGLGAAAIVLWRLREAGSAVTEKTILIPPLGMATGLAMFVMPAFRVPWTWALAALAAGAVVLAYPVVMTTKLEKLGAAVVMRRSNAFIAVTLGAAAVRLALRGYLDPYLSLQQSAALFYLLAFGMIARWRAQMWVEYRRLTAVEVRPGRDWPVPSR
jgi:membrane protein CcdC involved in cytochrome C biogenesis